MIAPAMDELLAFLGAGITDLKTTAALTPSSAAVVSAMIDPLPLSSARCIVELGAGTGPMTGAILERLHPEGRLLAFEINPKLVEFLTEKFPDPRLIIVPRSAELLPEELGRLGLSHADGIVSSLGLTLFPDALRHGIIDAAASCLRPGGILTQFVYMHGRLVPFKEFDDEFQPFPAEEFLGARFSKISRRQVWRNLPPAFVYECRK